AKTVIAHVNQYLSESRIGYRFDPNTEMVVRIDSELAHQEIVEPVVPLLRAEGFEGAEDEFRMALAHFRAGEYRQSNTFALSAFESTMKSIAIKMGWPHKN